MDAEHWYREGNARQDEGRDDLAAECYERVVALQPAHARAWNNLGASRQVLGRIDDAIDAYRQALGIDPRLSQAALNLGHLMAQAGRLAEAAQWLERAGDDEALGLVRLQLGQRDAAEAAFRSCLARDPARLNAYLNLAGLAIARADHAAAERLFGEAQVYHPDNPTLSHMRAAMRGETPTRPAEGYVTTFFDGVAGDFDRKLRALGYDMPERLAALARPHLRPGARVMDLGCGTGLVGVALRGSGTRVHGVDLSAPMLQLAAGTGAYERLEQADVSQALRGVAPGSLDGILSADVFIYVGALEEVFEAAAGALAPGGLFAFSAEVLESGTYRLLPSGRYAHSAGYIGGLAARHGLKERHFQRVPGRRDYAGVLEFWVALYGR